MKLASAIRPGKCSSPGILYTVGRIVIDFASETQPMIDPETEMLMLPKDACRMIPGRAGRGVSRATLWRWMMVGLRGVKLESCLCGGVRYTSRHAVRRFIAAVNGHAHVTKPADQSREARRVEALLDAEGF